MADQDFRAEVGVLVSKTVEGFVQNDARLVVSTEPEVAHAEFELCLGNLRALPPRLEAAECFED